MMTSGPESLSELVTQASELAPKADAPMNIPVNIIDHSDEEILAIAHPWWDELIKHSNRGQYGKFIRNFSYDLLLGLNEVELGKQFKQACWPASCLRNGITSAPSAAVSM